MPIWAWVFNEVVIMSVALVPVSAGIAILKYHLYDIDVVVNRTLVYGLLTALLALIYFGGVTATQAIFYALTGQEEQEQLGRVCKTLVRERSWHDTRRFDRPTMGTLGATPAASKAREGPSECRSSPYHKRHPLDRSNRITLARPPREVWSVEDGGEPLLPLAESRGLGSHTPSSPESQRRRRRVGLGGALPGRDHS